MFFRFSSFKCRAFYGDYLCEVLHGFAPYLLDMKKGMENPAGHIFAKSTVRSGDKDKNMYLSWRGISYINY